jgi:hypothetical protein
MIFSLLLPPLPHHEKATLLPDCVYSCLLLAWPHAWPTGPLYDQLWGSKQSQNIREEYYELFYSYYTQRKFNMKIYHLNFYTVNYSARYHYHVYVNFTRVRYVVF